MNDFVENLKRDLREISKKMKEFFQELKAKITGKPVQKQTLGQSIVSNATEHVYEINLVPNVKMQMIKALKMRNLVLFICILVSSIAVGVVVVLLGVKGGQDIAISNQDKKLETMSGKLTGYEELENLITIQAQLKSYEDVTENKKMLSRVFGALGVMLPQGEDEVQLSALQVNLTENLVSMEGQADAKTEPLIDYRVLEAFRKSADLTHYDYGRYVDVDGKELPAYCITETDENGNALSEGNNYYAWWDITVEGCEALPRSVSVASAEVEYHYSASAEVETVAVKENAEETESAENTENSENAENTEKTETVETIKRVKIWRTPQYTKWYKAKEMALDGTISGIEHFESECTAYAGIEVGKEVKWTSSNSCILVPDGLKVSESSNGRDSSDNLVLRFVANVQFAKEFFAFENKHMIAIGPMGQNVTDSYVQIGSMFTQEAKACDKDDTECLSNKTEESGE